MKYIYKLFLIFFIACNSNNYPYNDFLERVDEIYKSNLKTKKLANGWYETTSKENEFKRINAAGEVYYLNPSPVIIPENFESYSPFTNEDGQHRILIQLDEIGIQEWKNATQKNIGFHLVFILDDKIISSPLVNTSITNGTTAFFFNSVSAKDILKIIYLIKE